MTEHPANVAEFDDVGEFEEVLIDLIAEAEEGGITRDEIMGALELRLMALNEEVE